MRFRLHSLVPTLAAVAMLGGCTIHHVRTTGTVRASGSVSVTTPTYVTVADAPPPLKPGVQVRPAPGSNGSVWIEGHWSWNGGWAWVDGHWDSPPQQGYVWEPPVCVAVADGGYQYHRGYWRPRDRQPPTVYRTDGTIRVHVRPADEPARANRVVVRAGEPPPRTVVVTSSAREGSSSSVTVRGSSSATVRTRPAGNDSGATVRTRPAGNDSGATVRTRPAGNDSGATVRTRPAGNDSGATVRTRPAGNDSGATVRTRPGNGTATVRGNDATATTTVRPASNARGNNASANTTVRPASNARGNNASANTTVRPASNARGNNASANTTVRPASNARGNNASANTTVRTPGSDAQPSGPRSCRLQVAVLPRNGVLVIRGSGLAAATGVMIGSQRVPLLDKQDDRVRARVQGRNHGGSVKVLFGNQQESCGTLRITGN